MKIQPINNTTFGTKIDYNKTVKAGFELAQKSANSPRKKDLDFAKTFTDDIRTILENKNQDTVSFKLPKPFGVFTEIIDGEQQIIDMPNEGYKCTVKAHNIASKTDKKATNKTIETLKSQLEGTMALVEELKEKYSKALIEELDNLENQIKKSNI